MAVFLAPGTALAQNECGLQVGTTPVDCDQGAYGSGVTYDAVGDLFVDFTNTPTTTIGGNGVVLTGDLGESITFDSQTTGTELQSSGVDGALLDVTTVDGNITIDTEEMDADASAALVTHGIFAESTGTGSIDIATTGPVDAQGSNPADSIGIEALASGGNVNIVTGDNVSGNQNGIRAVNGGAGTVSIEVNGTTTGGDAASIDATTGTGLLSIHVGGSGSLRGNGGNAIRADAGGDILIDVDAGALLSTSNVNNTSRLDLTAAGTITINNAGRIFGPDAGGSSSGSFTILPTADSLVLTNTADPGDLQDVINGVIDNPGNDLDGGVIRGPLDFSNLNNGYTFNNNGVWRVEPSSSNPQRVSNLGAGTFNNAGVIRLGGGGSRLAVIRAQGTTFNGLANSVLHIPMTLSNVGQTSCDALTVASCLDLTGGTTSGQTGIRVTSVAPPLDPAGGLTTAYNPGILLVDVGGGSSAAEHFVVHPASENYGESPLYGGVVTTGGPLVYGLLYNPNTQQHILAGVPTEEGIEYATFIDEALSIWHTTADTVAGRQADLRGGATGGAWARLVSERTTRDAGLAMTTHGNDFTFNVSYEQETRAALFGFDVWADENYVVGVHGGLISSDTAYDNTGSGNDTKGAAAGVYGGWWQDLGIGQLTVDATANGNFLKLDHDASYEVTHSDIQSLGVRAEAGWRVPVTDGFYVQPLATAAYVRGDIEEMELRRNDISFEDSESQRLALGLRLGGQFDVESGITARYWLTGRAWNENAEDGRVEYAATNGEPLAIGDDISGSFEEVGLGASLSNKEDTLSVYASGGSKFIDDVTNYNVSVGGRLRW